MKHQRISPEQALIYAMITTAAVDRKLSDEELKRIGSIVRELPPFVGYSENWLMEEAKSCGKLLSEADGLDKVLHLVHANLPAHLAETAYVLCAEVAASDLSVKAEEVRFLELLAERLSLDKLACAALERAAKARHQKV